MNTRNKQTKCKVYAIFMLVITLLFSQISVIHADDGIIIKLEKKNITISAAKKSASIKTGDNIVISGEGLGNLGHLVSVGIIPSGSNTTNVDKIYENVKIIYSNPVDYKSTTYGIKNGKFSVNTRFFCAFEASSIPKGSYRAVVWYIPKGQGSKENLAVSTKTFSTLGDGKLIVLGDSRLNSSPVVEKKDSTWEFIFEPSTAVRIQNGDYFRFEGIPNDTVLMSGAKATLKSGKLNIAAKVTLENSKTVKGKKDLVVRFSTAKALAAKTSATLVIEKIKNPKAVSLSVFCGFYSKSNVLTGYGSGSLYIIEPPPIMKITQAPPEKLTFKIVDGVLQSDSFTVTVGFDTKNQSTGVFMLRLVDENGEFISSRDLAFFRKIDAQNTSSFDQVSAEMVDGKAVFNNIVLATYNDSLKHSSVYLYFENFSYFMAEPATSKAIKLEISQ